MNNSTFKTEVVVSLEPITLAKVFLLCGCIFVMYFGMKRFLNK